MKLTGLNHITINVKDLEASKAFYEKIFGLRQCAFTDMGDHTLTYYPLPQGVLLELIDYEDKNDAGVISETDTGIYRHMCLEADSLDELYERCRENNVYVRSAPAYNEKLGRTNMLLTDPSGVEIEVFLDLREQGS
jgi:lactoylglutathione lyase